MPDLNVGVIGLGITGQPIATRLVNAGFRVAVYEVRDEPVVALREAGAIPCTSPAEVARQSDMIVSLVSDRAQTDDVVFGATGILHGIRPGSIFATGSTLGPTPVKRIAQALAEKDCATLDIPFTGGYIAAREGTLSLMVGGAQETLDRALPVLRTFARTITRAGEVGAGQVAKLAHQLVFGVNVVALLEGLSLGVAGGVEPRVLKEIIRSGIGNSNVLQLWDDLGPRWKDMLKSTPPGAALPNLRKDLHEALELGHDLGVNLYVGAQASLIADAGVATGHDNPSL